MVHTIIMPDLGQTTAEGKILRWLKNPGEKVLKGDHLLEVETDKVTIEVESFVSGYLRRVLAVEGQMASALAPIALVADTLDEPLQQIHEPKVTAPTNAPEHTVASTRTAAPSAAGLAVAPAAKAESPPPPGPSD